MWKRIHVSKSGAYVLEAGLSGKDLTHSDTAFPPVQLVGGVGGSELCASLWLGQRGPSLCPVIPAVLSLCCASRIRGLRPFNCIVLCLVVLSVQSAVSIVMRRSNSPPVVVSLDIDRAFPSLHSSTVQRLKVI